MPELAIPEVVSIGLAAFLGERFGRNDVLVFEIGGRATGYDPPAMISVDIVGNDDVPPTKPEGVSDVASEVAHFISGHFSYEETIDFGGEEEEVRVCACQPSVYCSISFVRFGVFGEALVRPLRPPKKEEVLASISPPS